VSVTDAGERLVQGIGHRFYEIDAKLDALTALRDKTCRPGAHHLFEISHANVHLAEARSDPAQLPRHRFEIDVSYELRNTVEERFDAGVRLGRTGAKGHDGGFRRAQNCAWPRWRTRNTLPTASR
jgi:hypothetical protein